MAFRPEFKTSFTALPPLLLTILVVMRTATAVVADEPVDADALKLFEQRIMPIFKSEKPSSCVQCHLSSVDIKNYILPSHRDTFLALREEGLVDIKEPESSKILKLIRMGDKDLDKGARLIHEKTRKAEYEAFSSWIKACCQDTELCNATAPARLPSVGPETPPDVVRHARKSRVVESFTRNVWSQRMRCFPCHTPHELDESNPKHGPLFKRHDEFVKKFGRKMDIFGATPEETMAKLIASSRRQIPGRYPLINIEAPAHSLLLLKPTSKIPPKKDDGTFAKPSSADPVSHMGGLKMHVNDQSYKSFMLWLQDYAAVAKGEYVSVDDLPIDNWIPTKRVLRLKDIPQSWGNLTVVQLFVYSGSPDRDSWSDEPIAFTQSLVTPRRMAMGPLSLFRFETDAGHDHAPLRPGKYLIKAYVDAKGRVAKDPTLLLGSEDFVGQTVIDAQWQIGFPKAETVSATQLKK